MGANKEQGGSPRMNRYAYTRYDPVNYLDPSGYFLDGVVDWFSNGVKNNPISFVTGIYMPLCVSCWAAAGILERGSGESIAQGAANGALWGGVGAVSGAIVGVLLAERARGLFSRPPEEGYYQDPEVARSEATAYGAGAAANASDKAGAQAREAAARAGEVPYGEGYRGSSYGSSVAVGKVSGTAYDTSAAAALAALELYNPQSIMSQDTSNPLSTGLEFGGLIYELGGKYYFTPAVVGEVDELGRSGGVDVWRALGSVPSAGRSRIVGDYHTHGGPNPLFPGEVFSGFHYEPGSELGGRIAHGDIAESRNDLTTRSGNILNIQTFTSFLGTPAGRFGAYNPYLGSVFTFSPHQRLLPSGQTVPASSYAH